jgi:adenylate cyclase, class 2
VREIEVKYRVDDLEALVAALKARGIEPGQPCWQDDQAYAPVGWRFGDSKLGVSFLRLRTVNGRHFFTLKQPADNAQACLEYETEVADRDAMHHAALHMGYRPTVRIAKTRRTASVGDFTLCIDDLEGVGGWRTGPSLCGPVPCCGHVRVSRVVRSSIRVCLGCRARAGARRRG